MNLGKSVILLAFIDLIFGALYAIYNPLFFLPLVFASCGYIGAKNYNKCLIFIYGANILISKPFQNRLFFLLLCLNLSSEDKSNYIYSFAMIIICGLMGLWIAKK